MNNKSPIGNGTTGASKIGAIAVEDIGNNLIFTKECVFSNSKRFTINGSAGADVWIVLDSSALNVAGRFLILEPVFLQAFGSGPIEVDLFAGTVYTAETGTIWDGFNRNTESEKEGEAFFVLNPTITNDGVQQGPEFEIPSNGIPAVASAGGQANGRRIINLRKDINWALRFRNTETDSARGLFSASWFEL